MRFGPRAFLIFADDTGARREIEVMIDNISFDGVLTLAEPPDVTLRRQSLANLAAELRVQLVVENLARRFTEDTAALSALELRRILATQPRRRKSKGDRHRHRHTRWSMPR